MINKICLEKFISNGGFQECLKIVISANPIYSLFYLETLFGFTDFRIPDSQSKYFIFSSNHNTQFIEKLDDRINAKSTILKLMSEKFIKNVCINYIPSNAVYEYELNKFLDNLYIMSLPNGNYGRTLCNLSIILNDFSEVLIPELIIAAWFIIALHEFSHYLQRCLFSTHGEILSILYRS